MSELPPVSKLGVESAREGVINLLADDKGDVVAVPRWIIQAMLHVIQYEKHEAMDTWKNRTHIAGELARTGDQGISELLWFIRLSADSKAMFIAYRMDRPPDMERPYVMHLLVPGKGASGGRYFETDYECVAETFRMAGKVTDAGVSDITEITKLVEQSETGEYNDT